MVLKEKVSKKIHSSKGLLEEVALKIGNNPEMGFNEYIACNTLIQVLDNAGFKVESGLANLQTAFRADLGKKRPRATFICEYDALPNLGHACGHNLIATASLGAALGIAPFLKELAGSISVLGTPAEETGGGKVILVNDGVFNDMDLALMFHPAGQNLLMCSTNALDAYEFIFIGKTAHAATAPEEGINALDSVIQLFNGINALKGRLNKEVSVQGIISEGGDAPNIVPGRASARFYLRAPSRVQLDKVVDDVIKIAKGSALMTGTRLRINQFEYSNENFVPNKTLSLAFGANLQRLGVEDIQEFEVDKGSTDMGNISKIVPSIHPYLSIGQGLTAHTKEFAEASLSEEGLKTAILAAEAMAHTVVDMFTNPNLYKAVKSEHESHD